MKRMLTSSAAKTISELLGKFLVNLELFRRIARLQTIADVFLGVGTAVGLFLYASTDFAGSLVRLLMFVVTLITWGLALIWWTEDVQAHERKSRRTSTRSYVVADPEVPPFTPSSATVSQATVIQSATTQSTEVHDGSLDDPRRQAQDSALHQPTQPDLSVRDSEASTENSGSNHEPPVDRSGEV